MNTVQIIETLLSAFKKKMLRRILGPVCVERQWRSHCNDELYEMHGKLAVMQRNKLDILRVAGHVVRMETDDPARKAFLGHPQGQRRRGRPKLRWKVGVEAYPVKAEMARTDRCRRETVSGFGHS